jgi:glycosyltransferase involved in cell wall biosynthesis
MGVCFNMLKRIDFNAIFAFIMPHWRSDEKLSTEHLDQAVNGILGQTDSNWILVIVDDHSPDVNVREYLYRIKERAPDKIHLLFNTTNIGAGASRNRAVKYAASKGATVALFNDVDDVSDPKRLETVRRIFSEDAEVNVVYSTFKVIDEFGDFVPFADIAPAILEILDGHKQDVVEGYDSWISIATMKNYTNLTSSTAVRIELALKEPFYSSRISEDTHTWLRYGAHEGKFVYDNTIPSLYRIRRHTESSSRARISNFYEIKAQTDEDGFFAAMKIATSRCIISKSKKEELTIKFYLKLAESLLFGKQKDLALAELLKAITINKQKTDKFISLYGTKLQELYSVCL